MTAPIFVVCAGSPEVTALLGTSPTRLYPHGEAPEGTTKPYAVWQVVSGSPINYVSGVPDTDRYGLQVDVYAETASSADAVVGVLRKAIAQQAYITGFGIDARDKDTRNYRKSFDVAWLVSL
ncbi:DUF3168 domain-containing protein [Pseudomonas protegens]|uniref:DUF3168 domain-containing protein n=1 Tax=Pseudomonas protegens TaxID=380021 RepID=UPI00287EDB9C|nr:DUF3168 domain-containing protein [Pseudomonas protegens]MDS9879443.1 DUF3168 domain-containing protein [Pseudomonas protegens]